MGRVRKAWTGAGVLTALGATWLAVGLNPQLEPGEVTWASEAFAQDDGASTWKAVDPERGEARFMVSYRNAGSIPVRMATVPDVIAVVDSGLAVIGEVPVLLAEHATAEVTVPRDGQVSVWQTVDFPCADFSAGSGIGLEHVVVDVTTLGITRRFELPLPGSAVLRTTAARTCPDG